MPTWLLICLIVFGAICFCFVVFLIEKRKAILKKIKDKIKSIKLPKKKPGTKKQKKNNASAVKQLPSQNEEDVSFVEKEIIITDEGQKLECEPYEPDVSFNDAPEYDSYRPAFRRRRTIFDQRARFNERRNLPKMREPIKDQIKSLSPEMKAILFANVLDSKLDDSDKF